MTNIRATAVLLVLVVELAGCGSSGPSAPLAPSIVRPEPGLLTFKDAASGLSTSDLRDVDEQIVRFNGLRNELIWVADGLRFPGYSGSQGNVYIQSDEFALEVRFGTKDGERRAYLGFLDDFTYPPNIADIEVVEGKLVITDSDVPVP